jgi:hypothetical protein
MITQIKTALLGDDARSNARLPVNEVDPFRPSIDLADDRDDVRVDMDDVFGILGNERRRYVLTYLSMTDGAVTLSDVAERIDAWECDKPIAHLDSQERKRVYVGLYQCHLPKMAEAAAISYNKPRGLIEQGEHFDAYTHYLRDDT